ncbi:matrixin family metalloprotease [Levilactobacillus yiduensis]|uniref:matrixin family metalloprotease n=1 Tax=Levilactobacillus yiduensis TaxID=2953880 RepID=UPI000EF2A4D9|nr:matrixin family metalloprotease [Levilactobacillus yiduensis]AYM03426.1 Zn-dependent protease [Levilactobacillus brevis]
MRKRLGLLLVVIIGGLFLLPNLQGSLPKIVAMSQTMAVQATNQLTVQLPLMGRQEKSVMTPIESIVEPQTLKKTYYYRFAGNLPDKAVQTFGAAIAIYNDTGIVNLVAGDATDRQNGMTIFGYHKVMPADKSDYLELGKGGPEIEEVSGFQGYTANHARAGVNLQYPQGVKLSVALHEVGHALGLDHSSSRRSVMYPIDQGKSALSAGDLKALHTLYE